MSASSFLTMALQKESSQEGGLRPMQYTLTRSAVHTYAAQLLTRHLQLTDYTRRGENWRGCPAGANRHNLHPRIKMRRHYGLRRCASSPSRTKTSRRSPPTA